METEDLKNIVIENRKKLYNSGKIIINSAFTDELLEDVFFQLDSLANNKLIEEIDIYINSYGGDVFACLTLGRKMELISKTKIVKVTVLGYAYSAGCILTLFGSKGYRRAYKYADFLIHEVASCDRYSKASQKVLDADNIKRINNTLKEILKEKTKMSTKEIDKYMESNKDICINSTQALKYGLIDEII